MADLLIGRVIAGKFAIESPIGTGAMGAVYRARHVGLDKAVAVKVLHQTLAKDPTFAARLQLEAKAASRLDHPNSVRVIDFGEEPDGLVYIAMELLDGHDLLRVIDRDWPLPDERIVDLLSQTLSALAQAHDMGVVHRDLKPENIMLLSRLDDEGRPRDVVKVCDFGIAKIADQGGTDATRKKGGRALTTTGMIIGTPEYMSPEQCRGESLDARSDLYSVGVILYQLLTGRVPFQADSALDIVLKHISQEPAPPSSLRPEVSAHLERVCMRALQKSRDDRPATAREMRAGLRTSQGSLVAARVASTPRVASVVADTLPSMQRGQAIVPRSPPPSPGDETHLTTTSTGLRDFRRGSRAPWYWVAGAMAAVGAVAATMHLSRRDTPPVAATLAVASVASVARVPTADPVAPSAPPTEPAPAAPEPPRADRGSFRRRLRLPVPSLTAAPPPNANVEPPPAAAPVEALPPAPPVAPPPAPPVAAVSLETRPSPAGERSPPEVATPPPSRVDPSRGRVSWSVSGAGGGATASNVARALARASGAWQRCYEAGLAARSSRLEGTTTMRLSCDDEGRIIGASFTGLDAPDVNACLRAGAAGITVPNADTGDAWATVVLTFKVID